MFTGIVEEIGKISAVKAGKMVVACQKVLPGTKMGDSIAVNGACLTVIDFNSESFTVDIMPETLRLTNLGKLIPGSPVNLERPLTLSAKIGGHLVQGHIDSTARVHSLRPEGEAVIMAFSAPPEILRYVVVKGFIAVDGVSLTVVKCDDTMFSISLVEFSRRYTTLGQKRAGDEVNIEVDILGKYVEKLIRKERGVLTEEFLKERGF